LTTNDGIAGGPPTSRSTIDTTLFNVHCSVVVFPSGRFAVVQGFGCVVVDAPSRSRWRIGSLPNLLGPTLRPFTNAPWACFPHTRNAGPRILSPQYIQQPARGSSYSANRHDTDMEGRRLELRSCDSCNGKGSCHGVYVCC